MGFENFLRIGNCRATSRDNIQFMKWLKILEIFTSKSKIGVYHDLDSHNILGALPERPKEVPNKISSLAKTYNAFFEPICRFSKFSQIWTLSRDVARQCPIHEMAQNPSYFHFEVQNSCLPRFRFTQYFRSSSGET